ncbi:MAG: hypothetical protein HY000_05335 [Planctomycetes bacterium]|nr:hypothetical protein [Planctomycetota bacterium]
MPIHAKVRVHVPGKENLDPIGASRTCFTTDSHLKAASTHAGQSQAVQLTRRVRPSYHNRVIDPQPRPLHNVNQSGIERQTAGRSHRQAQHRAAPPQNEVGWIDSHHDRIDLARHRYFPIKPRKGA